MGTQARVGVPNQVRGRQRRAIRAAENHQPLNGMGQYTLLGLLLSFTHARTGGRLPLARPGDAENGEEEEGEDGDEAEGLKGGRGGGDREQA